jgi:hypothetical protein
VVVENDYNALVFRLNDLAEELARLKFDVDRRLLEEKSGGLEPNETQWVNLLALRTNGLWGLGQGPQRDGRDGSP